MRTTPTVTVNAGGHSSSVTATATVSESMSSSHHENGEVLKRVDSLWLALGVPWAVVQLAAVAEILVQKLQACCAETEQSENTEGGTSPETVASPTLCSTATAMVEGPGHIPWHFCIAYDPLEVETDNTACLMALLVQDSHLLLFACGCHRHSTPF